MYDYDEIYEMSEVDILLNETSNKLIELLKEKNKFKLQEILEENRKLKEDNAKMKKEFNKLAEKKHDLEIEKQNLKQELRNEKISELFVGRDILLFYPEKVYKKIEKCNKCDDKRKLKTKSQHTDIYFYEDCECNKSYHKYEPVLYFCYEIQNNNKDFSMFYLKQDSERGEYFNSGYIHCSSKDLYKDTDRFQDLKERDRKVFFKNEIDCQIYCNWLNVYKD